MGFQIQQKSIAYDIWVAPDRRYDWAGPVRSTRTSELVAAIHEYADRRTLSFPAHLRIVTDDGEPVSRWKVWSGGARQLRRRY